MNPHGNGKNEPTDPEHVLRMVELELAQQRIARQQARSPLRAFRVASFIFLFAVLVGIALAFYYVFVSGGLDDFRSRKQSDATATPSSHAP